MEEEMMFDIECPWCDEPATVDLVASSEFACAGCAVRVEVVAAPVNDGLARAA
jgi:hypothetical protein